MAGVCLMLLCAPPTLAKPLSIATPQDNDPNEEDVVNNDPPYIKQMKIDAEQGNAKAQSELANAYFVGIGVNKNLQEAIRLWRLAAEQGNGRANSMLGTLHYQGVGVAKDSVEAIKYWQKGAEQYDTDAMSQLGYAYLVGDSLAKNTTMAYMWFNLAAAHGDRYAPKARDDVSKTMTGDMVAEAHRLAHEWEQQHPKPAN